MPALVAGIHVLTAPPKDVDGRDMPGHDEKKAGGLPRNRRQRSLLVTLYALSISAPPHPTLALPNAEDS
jgi:hypothetical protein